MWAEQGGAKARSEVGQEGGGGEDGESGNGEGGEAAFGGGIGDEELCTVFTTAGTRIGQLRRQST